MSNVTGMIQKILWNKGPNRVYFEGFAYIPGVDIERSNKIKKSLIISDGNKKFFVPIDNKMSGEITEAYGLEEFNYDYAGFKGFIDLGFINDMKPISAGEWKIGLYVNTGDEEIEFEIPYKDDSLPVVQNKVLQEKNTRNFYDVELTLNSENQIVLKVESFQKTTAEVMKAEIQSNPLYVQTKDYLKKKKQKLSNNVMQMAYQSYLRRDVIENRVTFLSDSRTDFSGNFEFVYKELQERGGYEIKSLLKPSIKAKRSFKEKLEFLEYLATSKYILLDDYYPQIYKYKIKDEIEVIQLWHATGAFKTFGFSRMGKKGGPSVRSKNHRNYTKAIVSSSSIKKHYAEAFGISEDKVIATGVPRTDIFFDEEYKASKMAELYEKYPILKEKKVIMFAPTFRGNGQNTAHYNFEQLDLDLMKEKLGDEYMVIMKLHPFIKEIPNWEEEYQDFILDLSHEREINDLLFISDILITDYSSVCFEYALLNRPMIFFAYDLEKYIASRDFYYPYEAFVPGPIVKTCDELVDVIQNQDFNQEKLEKFRTKFFDHLDGKSTERVVDLLKIEK